MIVVWHRWTESGDVFNHGIVDPVLVSGQLWGRGERGHRGNGLRGRVEEGLRHWGLGSRVSWLTPRLPGRQGLAGVLVGGRLGYGRPSSPLVHLVSGNGMAEKSGKPSAPTMFYKSSTKARYHPVIRKWNLFRA